MLHGSGSKSPSPFRDTAYGYIERLRRPASGLVVLVLALTVLFGLLDINASSDPPYLILSLNILFVGVPLLFLASIAARSFARSGVWPTLWLGAGSLAFGLTVLINGPMQTLTTINATITAHNISTLLGGVFYLFGAFFAINRIPAQERSPRRWITVTQVYIPVLAFVAAITVLSIRDLLPPFFIQGTGGTPLRQMVLITDIVLFFASGLIILRQYLRSRSGLLFWYSLGLLLTVLGLAGFLLQVKTGTPLNWMGRGAELLGGLYFFVAALVTLKEAREKHLGAGEAMANLFMQMEARLKESEERFFKAFHASPVAQTIARLPEGHWVEVNDSFLHMLEYTRQEVIGHTSAELNIFDPNERSRILQVLLESGKAQNLELTVRTKTGKLLMVLSSNEKISLNGQDYSLSTLIDVTERKRAEEALQQTRDYLDNLFNYANAPIIVWNPEYEITRFNHAFERLTGSTADEVLGKKLDILFPDDSREASMDLIRKTAVGERWEVVEIPILHRNGIVHIVLWNSATLYAPGGKTAIATIAQGQDITERKQAEEELRQRTVELEVSNKELEAFSYSVSHDLRAPLRSMEGFSQALLEDCGDNLSDEAKDYLRRIQDSSNLMAQLIDDLLKLSRVTRSDMHTEMVDLTALAEDVALGLSKAEPERKVEFTTAKDMIGHGDSHLLRIVLENLLGNAWKFTSKVPVARVEFGTAERNEKKAYFIRDNGAGFDMTYAGKLFSPFQRLHKASEYPGTGVGLASVQRIIRRHGGEVWAEGSVGKGATFYFTLG